MIRIQTEENDVLRIPSSLINASKVSSSKPNHPILRALPGEPGHYRLTSEPINHAAHHPTAKINTGIQRHTGVPSSSAARHSRPGSVEGLIRNLQQRFPAAQVTITSRARTVRRQAELMAQRRRANRAQFLKTYRAASHITEMDNWVSAHPNASEAEAISAFEGIINTARAHGARVSNHLSDQARDISIPRGGRNVQRDIRSWLQQQGAHVIDEHDATGGPHWHVDF